MIFTRFQRPPFTVEYNNVSAFSCRQTRNPHKLYGSLTHSKTMHRVLFLLFLIYLTSKPSARRHTLWASISFTQSGCSSPLNTTHSSLACLVSGQQQHIFLPLLIPTLSALETAGVEISGDFDAPWPIFHYCVVTAVMFNNMFSSSVRT